MTDKLLTIPCTPEQVSAIRLLHHQQWSDELHMSAHVIGAGCDALSAALSPAIEALEARRDELVNLRREQIEAAGCGLTVRDVVRIAQREGLDVNFSMEPNPATGKPLDARPAERVLSNKMVEAFRQVTAEITKDIRDRRPGTPENRTACEREGQQTLDTWQTGAPGPSMGPAAAEQCDHTSIEWDMARGRVCVDCGQDARKIADPNVNPKTGKPWVWEDAKDAPDGSRMLMHAARGTYVQSITGDDVDVPEGKYVPYYRFGQWVSGINGMPFDNALCWQPPGGKWIPRPGLRFYDSRLDGVRIVKGGEGLTLQAFIGRDYIEGDPAAEYWAKREGFSFSIPTTPDRCEVPPRD